MRRRRTFTIVLVALAALALAACGSSKKKSSSTSATPAQQPTTLSISVREKGKKASYTAPASTKGGLVTVTLQNNGKQPHDAQLVLIGNHTPAEVLKVLGSNSGKTPSWLRGEGGAASANPGQTSTGTVILPPGNYLLIDVGSMGNGPPGYKTLKVTAGQSGPLPSTGTNVTAAAPAKDKYKWQINGPLKAGENRLTFASKGKDAIHLIVAARVTGHPSQAQLLKALKSNGPPPKFIDQKSFTSTSALDGGKSEVTSLSLAKPGEYVLFCPLTDRDGGKPHLAEGLLTTVNVK
jgi:hypothetical protein